MDDDLISLLTRQVKEDVVENYMTERRLIGLQIEEVERQAEAIKFRASRTGKRLSRLAQLMVEPELMKRLLEVLHVPQPSFWSEHLEQRFARDIRFIRVRALTDKAKFRKLVLESYNRLCGKMERYRTAYEDLQIECRAVNRNIAGFHANFDLLSILNFLKSLDLQTIERKQYLGQNFTPEELASVDQKLYIRPLSFEQLAIPLPLRLPRPEIAERYLSDLANEVYQKHSRQLKQLMEAK